MIHTVKAFTGVPGHLDLNWLQLWWAWQPRLAITSTWARRKEATVMPRSGHRAAWGFPMSVWNILMIDIIIQGSPHHPFNACMILQCRLHGFCSASSCLVNGSMIPSLHNDPKRNYNIPKRCLLPCFGFQTVEIVETTVPTELEFLKASNFHLWSEPQIHSEIMQLLLS